MNPTALPIVILNPHGRCNCRCAMCDIWKDTEAGSLPLEEVKRQVGDFERLGVQWVVLSGGEALMHRDIFAICRLFRDRGIRLTLLSTGLLLERLAERVVENVDEVIVSLDGPEAIHDRIRGVRGAFASQSAGIRAIRARKADFPISARCTVQRANLRGLQAAVEAAAAMGLDSISFLAADVRTEAFNRPLGWTEARRLEVAPDPREIPALERELEGLIESGRCEGFIRESPEKLRRIARHFRVEAGLEEPVAPRCNAPWVSAVVEADGTVRPCFFHAPVGRIGGGMTLADVWTGPEAAAFRDRLDVRTNAICRRCVCSLNWTGPGAKSG